MSAPAPSPARATFSARQRRVIRHLAQALYDDGAAPGVDARLDWLVGEVDDFVGRAGWVTRLSLHLALFALEALPALLGFGPRRLTSLSREASVRYLARLERDHADGVGVALVSWKSVLTVLYFEHPDALAETNYDGACLLGEGSLLRGTRRPSRSLPVAAAPAPEVAPAAARAAARAAGEKVA